MSLSVYDLSFAYGNRTILDDISFEVAPGTFCALLGPNGSGKSTMVKAIAGVHRAKTGRISVEGRDTSSSAVASSPRSSPMCRRPATPPRPHRARGRHAGPHPALRDRPRHADRATVEDAIVRMGLTDIAEQRCPSSPAVRRSAR